MTVQPRTSWDLLDPDALRIALEYDADMALLDDLMMVRRVLEREMAAAAASRLTNAELDEFARLIDEMEVADDDYERLRRLTTPSTP
jgi:DNA-binding FadR family transcriptional regulator